MNIVIQNLGKHRALRSALTFDKSRHVHETYQLFDSFILPIVTLIEDRYLRPIAHIKQVLRPKGDQ